MKLKTFQTTFLSALALSFTAYAAITGLEPNRVSSHSKPMSASGIQADCASESTSNSVSVSAKILKAPAIAAPKTMAELISRNYVLYWIPNRKDTYQQGGGVNFLQVENTDSVMISWFYYDNAWKGKVNFENGTIEVPAQYVKTIVSSEVEHQVWFMPRVNNAFTPDPSQKVIFTFNEDGSLTADKGWGFMWYDTPGTGYTWTYEGANTRIYTANGSMSGTRVNSTTKDTLPYNYPVYATQDGNVLSVLNFADNGCSANFLLSTDSTITVPRQVQVQTTNVDYEMAGNVTVDEQDRISWNWSYKALSAKPNGFKLGPWSLIGYHKTTGGMYWYGLYNYADFTFDFDIDYSAKVFDGAGTSSNPYIISNATDLNNFISFAEKGFATGLYFKQTSDINLGNQALTTPLISKEFNGTYDGGGFSLSGLNLTSSDTYKGIFSTIGEGGTIKNLTLEGEATFSKTYNAPLAGSLYGTLENVTSKMTITTGATYTGGLVGYAYAGSSLKNCEFAGTMNLNNNYAGGLAAYAANATFENCGFTGKLLNAKGVSTAINYVGGLVAYSYPSSYIKCYSNGTMSADSLSTYRAGLVAYGYAQTTETGVYGKMEFKGCTNRTNVKGKGYMGGIVGYCVLPACITATNYKFRSSAELDSCVNYGEIYTTANGTYTGGIVGTYGNPSVISNCQNYGTIKGWKGNYVGGIAGATSSTAANDSINSKIINCQNYGELIDVDNSDANALYNAGGILGQSATSNKVINCQNYADIKATYNTGGIVGYLTGINAEVTGCTNYGKIDIQGPCGGGIVALGSSYSQTISDNVNFGEVSTSATTPGTTTSFTAANKNGGRMGGIVGNGYGMIRNNLNTAPVTGASLVGGVAGNTNKGTSSNFGTKVFCNLNTGKVLCRYIKDDKEVQGTDSVGAISGGSLNNPLYWVAEYNAQDSNYYTPNVVADLGELSEEYLANHMGTQIKESELINSVKLGEAWSCYDKYCYPVPTAVNSGDAAKVWAAQVVPEEGDVLPRITGPFNVGAPQGLVWTSTNSGLTFNGTNATWSNDAVKEDVTITATCGEYSKSITLQVDKISSVEDLETESEIITERWLNTAGQTISKPTSKDGQVYILIRVNKTGKMETIKVLN